MRTRHLLALVLCGSAWLSSTAAAQVPRPESVMPAPRAILTALELGTATLQDLVLPHARSDELVVSIQLDRQLETLRAQHFSMLTEGFELLVDDGTGPVRVPHSRPNTYRGFAVHSPASDVALSWSDRQIRGVIALAEETWVVQPLRDLDPSAPRKRHVVYRASDIQPDGRHPMCELTTGTIPDAAASAGGATTQAAATLPQPQLCELAFDCDFAFFQQNGSDVLATQNAALDLMLAVDVIFRRDVSICYSVPTIIVRTAPVYTLGPELGCSGMGPGLLDEMQTIWLAQQQATSRDIAHLLTGQGAAMGAAGCANFDAICSSTTTGFGFGATRAVSINYFTNAGLLTHELGHNWSAPHCDGLTGCSLMCATLGLCGPFDRFGPTASAQIDVFRATRPCLSNCAGCADQASADYFGDACAGSGVGAGPDCLNLNFDQSSADLVFNQPFFGALPANSGLTGKTIESVDFFVRALTPLTVPIEILAADPLTGLPAETLGATTMSIGTPLSVYTATFASPVGIPANTDFFVCFQTPGGNFIVSLSAPGAGITPTPWYFLSQQGTWFEQPPDTWHYRLNCQGSSAGPLLSTVGYPRLGGAFGSTLDSARPNALCALLWGSTTAQADLTILGAPGCSLFIDSVFFTIDGTTSALGQVLWPFNVPNDASFCGQVFFQQAVVFDPPANALQLALTRRGTLRFGN